PFGFRGELTTAQPGGATPNVARSGFDAKRRNSFMRGSSLTFWAASAQFQTAVGARRGERAIKDISRIGRALSRPAAIPRAFQNFGPARSRAILPPRAGVELLLICAKNIVDLTREHGACHRTARRKPGCSIIGTVAA